MAWKNLGFIKYGSTLRTFLVRGQDRMPHDSGFMRADNQLYIRWQSEYPFVSKTAKKVTIKIVELNRTGQSFILFSIVYTDRLH